MALLLHAASDVDDCLCCQSAAQSFQVALHLLLKSLGHAAEEEEELEDMLPLISFIQGQSRRQVTCCWFYHDTAFCNAVP